MLEIERQPPIRGEIPCFRVTIRVPEGDVDIEAFERKWRDMYDRAGGRFYLMVDLTDPSIASFRTAALLPDVARVLSSLRQRTKKEVVATAAAAPPTVKWVIDVVTNIYKPARPLYTAATLKKCRQRLEAFTLSSSSNDTDGSQV